MESPVMLALWCLLVTSTSSQSVFCDDNFEMFTKVVCDHSPICLASTPNKVAEARSEIECGLVCQRQKQPPEDCISVNYRHDKNVCDVIYSSSEITNVSNFTKNDSGCQYIQRGHLDSLDCAVIFGNADNTYSSVPDSVKDVHFVPKMKTKDESTACFNINSSYPLVVDSKSCSFPYTYNGEILYECSPRLTGIPDKCGPSACFMSNRKAARCQQPADFIATYTDITVTTFGQVNVTTMSIFGWIVILSRNGTSGNWSQPWNSYKNGFTISSTDFWIGLERIHQLTSFTTYRVRFEIYIETSGLKWRSAEYTMFAISNEASKYVLTADGYSVDAKDAITPGGHNDLNGTKFYTHDVDSIYGCSNKFGKGGWWFNACATVCLTCDYNRTILFSTTYHIKHSRMMIKPN